MKSGKVGGRRREGVGGVLGEARSVHVYVKWPLFF